MRLPDALISAGMTPPQEIVAGRFIRFPGIGKGRSNRAGWCRLITPTLAIYGDWSSGLSAVWKDDEHCDDSVSRELLAKARETERRYAEQQRAFQTRASEEAQALIERASQALHPYLIAKGFPDFPGLVHDGKLLIPVRDCRDYGHVISVQSIDAAGNKLFLTGSRTRYGIHRVGSTRPKRIYLCEGYATALSLEMAAARLPGPHAVIACFSARNLELVAGEFKGATIVADNDVSGVGEASARKTGLRFWVPPQSGEDFNDFHQRVGLYAAIAALRAALLP